MKKAMEVLADLQTEATSNVNSDPVDDDEMWHDLEDDDASEIHALMESKGIERGSCFAHSLQLVVKDGIEALRTSSVLSKCSALATLVHHSPLFKSAFEQTFGNNRSVPVANATRWNSLLHQLEAVRELDHEKLSTLLQQTDHGNLVMSSRELSVLVELVEILHPFAEATDKTQGNSPRISCVVPTVVALHKFLSSVKNSVKHHTSLVHQLMKSLEKRFRGLLARIRVLPVNVDERDPYCSVLYPVSTVLDPEFGFVWLECDHPGDQTVKTEVRETITGNTCVQLGT
jgi:hypothetical protein